MSDIPHRTCSSYNAPTTPETQSIRERRALLDLAMMPQVMLPPMKNDLDLDSIDFQLPWLQTRLRATTCQVEFTLNNYEMRTQ